MRPKWFVLGLVAAGIFLGGGWLLQRRLDRAGPSPAPAVGENDATGKLFSSVFRTIRSHAVDSLDDQAIYRLATTGVLAELGDPYAALIAGTDSGPVERLGEPPIHGVYLDQPEGFVEVVAVVAGSPADQAGLKPGDAILRIDDAMLDGRRADQVRRMLDGPDGSTIRIRIGREGASGPLWLSLKRGSAPPLPPPAVSSLADGVGLLTLTRIDGTSARFVRRVVDSLVAAGAKGLAIDLRGVVEGGLAEAVALAGEFVGTGATIVTSRARAGHDSVVYRDGGGEVPPELPIVIVVDRATAGAAEVVAGALQDHDRGLVVGEVTFGRGAGQRLFPLGNGSSLRLTTTVWVTPSGRVIQRFPPPSAAEGPADTAATRPKFRTDGGRTVLGGGGIVPDREVTAPGAEPSLATDPSLALARELLSKARTRRALLATID